MKNKKIFKKWWFWVIVVVIVLGAIGSLGQPSNEAGNNSSQQTDVTDKSTLPKLNSDDYTSKEGLVVYKELQGKGYKIEAEFEKQALTDINGRASEVFESLDPNKSDDRTSVDSFVVGSLVQEGDSVKLSIVQKSN